MHFVDECTLTVQAGSGGNGAVAFRREKFVPLGGPAGGDGGRGGSVVFVGDEGLGTLHDLTHARTIVAARGEDGGNKDMYGRGGDDEVVRVPIGTVVTDAETGEVLFEITSHQQREVVARGGQGGRGNRHFTTSVDQAPRRAEPGEPGERRKVRLELKVMADVGLLGFPNVGKSTFISVVSRARPRIADYPFTTLEPHLGVVKLGDASRGDAQSFVIADIPGLIEGASEGAGLGLRFLRHVERTRLLLHLVSLTYDPERDPVSDYDILRRELERYDARLAEREELVVLTKADLPEVRDAYPDLQRRFAEKGIDLWLVSSATREGVDPLLKKIVERLSILARPPEQ
jgi:GTP-binding protein